MLLDEGINSGYVVPTEYSRKLTLDGVTQSYQVYKIRLDQLFYNDQNDRIATWVNKYKEENDLDNLNTYTQDYNKIIESFIYQSNSKALDKTKMNIEIVGQREPGVVLNDGRIIDGNRRFTCLNKIHENNININHFEAVILERDIVENKKEIKLLELAIQHGEEGKVDYNPIDKLVGLYNDVLKNKLITTEEYQKTVNEPLSIVNKRIEQAKLMVEFLEFIDAPEKFYIARDLELDGPLGEIPTILNKLKTEDEKEDVKLIIFNNLVMKPAGDITRFIRKFKTIADSEYLDDFIEEQMSFVEDTAEKIEQSSIMNYKTISNELRTNDDLQSEMAQSIEKFEIKSKKDLSRMKPIQDLKKVLNIIETIDTNLVQKISSEEKEEFLSLIDSCSGALEKISSALR